MSLLRFHWLRFIGAVVALVLALFYLAGFETISMTGFLIIAVYAALLTIRLARGRQQATCDLCGSPGILRVEHGPAFSGARLVLDCPRCGRVINTAREGMKPGMEKAPSSERKDEERR